jgi:hypothetical protein
MLAVSNIMNVIYGYEVERDDDPILKIVEEGGKVLGNVTRRGPWLVDFIPARQCIFRAVVSIDLTIT